MRAAGESYPKTTFYDIQLITINISFLKVFQMLTIIQDKPFHAEWNESNKELNPFGNGPLWNTIQKIRMLLFYIPNSIIAACINPRAESPFVPTTGKVHRFGNFNKEIITPDGIHLAAQVSIVNGATPDTPTTILFNPLGAEDEMFDSLRARIEAKGSNVISFNYRGLGTTWNSTDLVLDGDSVYQYAIEELGTQASKVHLFGYSLGSVLAAQVKALHSESEGKYVGDRPFKSVFSLITENCCIARYGVIVKKITSFISALFLAYPVYLLGWEWDTGKVINHLSGEKRVIYHPKDILIPYDASAATLCASTDIVCLDPQKDGPASHFAPLYQHQTHDGNSAVDVIADFLST